MCVQQFIGEMGFLIDQGDMPQQPPASTRNPVGVSLTAGRNANTQQNRTHYAGGGSGESTGGSASIF